MVMPQNQSFQRYKIANLITTYLQVFILAFSRYMTVPSPLVNMVMLVIAKVTATPY